MSNCVPHCSYMPALLNILLCAWIALWDPVIAAMNELRCFVSASNKGLTPVKRRLQSWDHHSHHTVPMWECASNSKGMGRSAAGKPSVSTTADRGCCSTALAPALKLRRRGIKAYQPPRKVADTGVNATNDSVAATEVEKMDGGSLRGQQNVACRLLVNLSLVITQAINVIVDVPSWIHSPDLC